MVARKPRPIGKPWGELSAKTQRRKAREGWTAGRWNVWRRLKASTRAETSVAKFQAGATVSQAKISLKARVAAHLIKNLADEQKYDRALWFNPAVVKEGVDMMDDHTLRIAINMDVAEQRYEARTDMLFWYVNFR